MNVNLAFFWAEEVAKKAQKISVPHWQFFRFAIATGRDKEKLLSMLAKKPKGYPRSKYRDIEEIIAQGLAAGPPGISLVANAVRQDSRLSEKAKSNILFAFNSHVASKRFERIGSTKYRFSIDEGLFRVALIFNAAYFISDKQTGSRSERPYLVSFQIPYSSRYRMSYDELKMFMAYAMLRIPESKEYREIIQSNLLPFEVSAVISDSDLYLACMPFNGQAASVIRMRQAQADELQPVFRDAAALINKQLTKQNNLPDKQETAELLPFTTAKANDSSKNNAVSKTSALSLFDDERQSAPEPDRIQPSVHKASFSSGTSRTDERDIDIFVIMPFNERFNGVWLTIEKAAQSLGLKVETADSEDHTGDIWEHIQSKISESQAVIVDVTDSNRNVILELGYAAGKSKMALIILQDVSHLPSDIQNKYAIKYENDKRGLRQLGENIRKFLVRRFNIRKAN